MNLFDYFGPVPLIMIGRRMIKMNRNRFRLGKKNLIEKLIDIIRYIYDPEISVNIYDLGLIYDIQIRLQANIKVIMTLTTPNCPIADGFIKEVKQKIQTIDKVKNIYIILTFDPKWNTEMLSEEANFQLQL